MDTKNEGEKIKARQPRVATGGAIIIANAIDNLADAIRTHARAMSGEEEPEPDEQFDLAGNPI